MHFDSHQLVNKLTNDTQKCWNVQDESKLLISFLLLIIYINVDDSTSFYHAPCTSFFCGPSKECAVAIKCWTVYFSKHIHRHRNASNLTIWFERSVNSFDRIYCEKCNYNFYGVLEMHAIAILCCISKRKGFSKNSTSVGANVCKKKLIANCDDRLAMCKGQIDQLKSGERCQFSLNCTSFFFLVVDIYIVCTS